MRRTILSAALGLMLLSNPVMADEAALSALQNAGVELTSEQANQVKGASDEQLADVMAAIAQSIAQQQGQDRAEAQVQAIVQAIAKAKPDLIQQISLAIVQAAPQMEIAVATAAIEADPTAAGPEQAQEVLAEVNPAEQAQETPAQDAPSQNPGPANSVVAVVNPPSIGGGGGAVSPN
ncbi:hypothetical protein [Thiomicrorhabdus sp. 6S3-12]|uniref:hypothetical protein n=1 Tax=Thiomicrorhabdus sp. 6S3-12 TaxID=2819681 RepID=UPI001AAD2470|nr:hypothetical protein [Thiomicrorhabdus sp. 6S3-12]MBO1923331.1 hypothetical protein [Thiomicrorhabdus sp. 6S3-12]